MTDHRQKAIDILERNEQRRKEREATTLDKPEIVRAAIAIAQAGAQTYAEGSDAEHADAARAAFNVWNSVPPAARGHLVLTLAQIPAAVSLAIGSDVPVAAILAGLASELEDGEPA